jgi:hypothetical protein
MLVLDAGAGHLVLERRILFRSSRDSILEPSRYKSGVLPTRPPRRLTV